MSTVVMLPKTKPAMPKMRRLRERDHAAVGSQEHEAHRDDAEDQHLRQQLVDRVGGEQQRRERHDRDRRPRRPSARCVWRSRRPPEDAVRPHGEHDCEQHERADHRVLRLPAGR